MLFRRRPRLVVFTAGYLLAAAIGLVVTRDMEFAFYFVSLLVIIGVVVAIDRRVRFSGGVLWGLSLWGAMHLAGGLVPLPQAWPYAGEHAVLYSGWILPQRLKYDQVVHAFGFGVTALAALQAMRGGDRVAARARWGEAVAAGLVACGLGSVNEILEFLATRISPENNVGGYVNTALDLVANFVGATAAMAIALWRGVR